MRIERVWIPARASRARLGILLAGIIIFSGAAWVDSAVMIRKKSITQDMRKAAAARAAEAKLAAGPLAAPRRSPAPGGAPDYFNYPNYANSPLRTGGAGGIQKFVNTLAGVGFANRNNLDQYIPVAAKDAARYPGSDYYELGLKDFDQQLHRDLPTTRLRGYADMASGAEGGAGNPHYLGPLIIAQRGRPVRVKFSNLLGAGGAGKLFLPMDATLMGAGMGPDGMNAFTENRATIHLHGGDSPWISDGTPHQWIVPAADSTPYKKGASQRNVPDMDDPGDGAATFFWPNQQSARLMFYHDHVEGLTRLNVYAGEAAGYLLTDATEQNLIATGVLPDEGGNYHYGIPLIIQDKTFVDSMTITAQDPTWNWGSTPGTARTGDLWFPHVYMPAENPADPFGVNAMGRWDYGPWVWPPASPLHGPNPDGTPGTPNPSVTPESYMDTPLVNGTAYPRLSVVRKPYRFRILNACNDRFLNLQLYYADASGTEVSMVPAVFNSTYPATWPTDARPGGVPAPETAGPPFIQIGTEGGFLPAPAEIPSTPISADLASHALFLGTAERADVIVDFSQVPLSVTSVILYNDMFAPTPGADPRYDYYTGNEDLTDIGGAPSTPAGYGPNTRTIMRFDLSGGVVSTFNLANLQAKLPEAYAASRPAPIVPQAAYNAPFGTSDADKFVRLTDSSVSFTQAGSTVTIPIQHKSLSAGFEPDYGRLTALVGVANAGGAIGLDYSDPVTENIQNGEAQLWRITNTDEDVHAMHFHLFNVQVVNRVGWAGEITPPDENELGWKDTVRTKPLEDTIVALKPIASTVPFTVTDSVRLLNPAMPAGASWRTLDPETGSPVTMVNELANFGHEYVWHCHILGHEENDMMRPVVFRMGPLSAVKLSGVYPESAAAGTKDITLSLTGEGFDPASTVRLLRAGQAPVEPSSVTVAGSTRINATFRQPFEAGLWSVAVYGNGQTVKLPNAFSLVGSVFRNAKVYQGVFKPLEGGSAQLTTSLASAGHAAIRVYDNSGRLVREIFDGYRAAGDYADPWDGRNDDGKLCASGMYLVRFDCPGFKTTKRVVLVK